MPQKTKLLDNSHKNLLSTYNEGGTKRQEREDKAVKIFHRSVEVKIMNFSQTIFMDKVHHHNNRTVILIKDSFHVS